MKARVGVAFLAALLVVGFVAMAATAQGVPWSQFDGILADKVVATVSVTAPDVNVSDDLAVTDAISAASLLATGNVGATTATFTGAMSAAGEAFSGNVSAGGTLSSIGALATASDLNVIPQSVITVTGSGVITPTGTFQMIQAAGTVTSGDIVAGTPGQLLILVNTVAQAITIPDSGDQILSGNAVLNQWDTLTLVYYGTKWVQVSESDN